MIKFLKSILRNSLVDHYRVLFFNRKNKDREIKYLKLLCKKDKASIDVGAAVGFYTHYILKHSSFCFCYEVSPTRAARLASIFPKKKVRVEEIALSNQKETSFLNIPFENGMLRPGRASIESENKFSGYQTKTIKVKTDKLDNFNLKNIGFIKIDVEGHELAVLEGSIKLITEFSPNFIIEAEERHKKNAVKLLSSFLLHHGYKGVFIYKNKVLDINDFNSNTHQNIEYIDDKYNYVNNFIFSKNQSVLRNIKSDFVN